MRYGHMIATNVVHYRLLEGGRVLEAVERVTRPGAHGIVWMFEKAPEVPGK